jgi:hypothetical protein
LTEHREGRTNRRENRTNAHTRSNTCEAASGDPRWTRLFQIPNL